MTLAEAKKALEPPLVFGDAAQIKAVRFLEQVEACSATIKACYNFDSHCTVERDAAEMDEEDYEPGSVFWEAVKACGCWGSFKDDVLQAALYQLVGEIYA